PEFWSSNFAVQASWAACCALEPAPARSPETPDELPLSLEPQAAAVSARTAEAARTSHHFLFIGVAPFSLVEKGRRLTARLPQISQRGGTLSTGPPELVTLVWRTCKKDVNRLHSPKTERADRRSGLG